MAKFIIPAFSFVMAVVIAMTVYSAFNALQVATQSQASTLDKYVTAMNS